VVEKMFIFVKAFVSGKWVVTDCNNFKTAEEIAEDLKQNEDVTKVKVIIVAKETEKVPEIFLDLQENMPENKEYTRGYCLNIKGE